MEWPDSAGVYIIDKDNRLVYFNDIISDNFPNIRTGQLCYEGICGRAYACSGCPAIYSELNNGVMYHTALNNWVEIRTAHMEWPGCGECRIILTYLIGESNKNVLYNLTKESVYEELFELNLTKDYYRIIYHKKDKYLIPAIEGVFSETYQQVADTMIHPEDRDLFLKYWGERLRLAAEGPAENIPARIEFRKLLQDGSYCQVSEEVVRVSQREEQDQILFCFIQELPDHKGVREGTADSVKNELEEQKSQVNLTGLDGCSAFYLKAETLLREMAQTKEYCLIAIDIEHFKLFNEWYGEKEGDKLLCSIGSILRKAEEVSDCLAGYMGADDFVLVMPYDHIEIAKIQEQISSHIRIYSKNAGFLPVFGIYPVGSTPQSVRVMHDRAVIALDSVRGNYAVRISVYDEKMKQKLEENQVLLSEIQRAFAEEEFIYYAQPKCNMLTGNIVGMESLVRWKHPEKGIVSPGEFVPMLEQNGFITKLDMYIWEKVCHDVRHWIDQGRRPIPVSVNVSRVDIYAIDVVSVFERLVEKYRLDPWLIEIEITESTYAEDYNLITDVVNRLRKSGFIVLMDDFGSGYSSLNMLKEVNVDILKIDMKFLELTEESAGRGVGILEAIVRMSRLMRMRIIAEGVENRMQADYLLDIGCVYGQGYYFFHPLPVKEFEALLMQEDLIDFQGIQPRQIEELDLRDLFNENLVSETLVNNILGGVAFYDVCKDKVELAQVNERFYQLIGYTPTELGDRMKTFLTLVWSEDRAAFLRIFAESEKNLLNGAEGTVRIRSRSGKTEWIRLKAFYLREQDNHSLYYGAIENVTRQKRQEENLISSQKALATALGISEHSESYGKLTDEGRRAASTLFAEMTPAGMIGGYCEDGFPLYFVNDDMVKTLGFDTAEELIEAIDGRVGNTIHPDDLPHVISDIGVEYYPGLEYTTTYRMPRKDGSWFWTLDKGRVIDTGDGRLAIVSACMDISDTMQVKQIQQADNMMRQLTEEIKFLNDDMPGGYHKCSVTPDNEFVWISNRFLDIFGYTREEIREIFQNKFVNMIHPDDREYVRQGLSGSDATITFDLEYRMLTKHGYIWITDQTKLVHQRDEDYYYGVVLDITETVKLRNELRSIVECIPENVATVRFEAGKVLYRVISNGLMDKFDLNREEYESKLNKTGFFPYIVEEDRKRVMDVLKQAVGEGRDVREMFRCILPGRKEHWIDLKARFMEADRGSITYVYVYNELSELQQKEMELWMADQTLASVIRLANMDIWEWDMDSGMLFWSDMSENSLFGMAGEKSEGKKRTIENFPDCLKQLWQIETEDWGRIQNFIGRIQGGESAYCDIPIRMYSEHIWVRMSGEAICDQRNRPIRAVGYVKDISSQKKEELELTQKAREDSLTGLYNRSAAIEEIDHYLLRNPEKPAALIIFDMDNFKLVNDVFGHVYGDMVIADNASALKRFFRNDDVVCRLGGDEFMVFCRNIDKDAVEVKLERITQSVRTQRRVEGKDILFTISAGYALVPEQGRTFNELYQNADIALFHTKMNRKGTSCQYDREMKAVRYELLEKDL